MNIINYIDGNAIEAFLSSDKNTVFLHGANCQGKMNSGIAKEVKRVLPELYHADLEFFAGMTAPSMLGRFSSCEYRSDSNRIKKMAFNLYTQERYGRERRHFNYGALVASLKSAIDYAVDNDVVEYDNIMLYGTIHVIMPKIGCGLGGGDWNVVEELLQLFPFTEIPVIFHVYSL